MSEKDSYIELVKLINSVAVEIRTEFSKQIDRIDSVKDSMHTQDVILAKQQGYIDALKIGQIEIIKDLEKIKRANKTIEFFINNPRSLKLIAIGYLVTILFAIYSGYATITKFTRDDNQKTIVVNKNKE